MGLKIEDVDSKGVCFYVKERIRFVGNLFMFKFVWEYEEWESIMMFMLMLFV